MYQCLTSFDFSLSSDDCPTNNPSDANKLDTNNRNGMTNTADSSSLSSNHTQLNENQNTNTSLISNNKVRKNIINLSFHISILLFHD